ncbi:MAG: L,D-transpeptidase [Pyrinomonadaceae bacterium]|nr:L,D-transpeptidase [Pyrinomonadaceae bacterium]
MLKTNGIPDQPSPSFVLAGWRLRLRHRRIGTVLFSFVCLFAVGGEIVLSQTAADRHESARSDKLTGGRVEVAEFEPNQPDIRITLNVPSFRLTFWQNGKEVQSYFVGVGMKNHPIYIGDREATEVIWNPAWIPPSSNWVREMKGVSPGEVIKASDPRNPLGKMKIPLGDSYLIHQARGTGDLGNLVSHGCVRMLRSELYDLAEKIIAARGAPVSRKRIEAAKRSSRMLVVRLDEVVPVDINYDTIVVEERVLHVYPDVYSRGTNRIAILRAELESAGMAASKINDKTLRQILGKVTRRTQFVVAVSSIEQGRALEDGKVMPLIPRKARQKPAGAVARPSGRA